jgi:THO complex subunit 3
MEGVVAGSSSAAPGCQELKGHGASVEHVCFSPADEDVLASLSADKTVKLWDTRTGQVTLSLSFPNFAGINFCWHPDGVLLAVGGKDDTVRIVNTATGLEVQNKKFPFEVNQMTWSPDGLLFCLTGAHGAVVVVDGNDLTAEVATLHGHTSNCYCISWPRQGKAMAVGAADALVSIWEACSDRPGDLACSRTIGRLDWPIRALSFSACGSILAAGSEDPFIDVAMVETGALISKVPVKGAVTSIAWHPRRWMRGPTATRAIFAS